MNSSRLWVVVQIAYARMARPARATVYFFVKGLRFAIGLCDLCFIGIHKEVKKVVSSQFSPTVLVVDDLRFDNHLPGIGYLQSHYVVRRGGIRLVGNFSGALPF